MIRLGSPQEIKVCLFFSSHKSLYNKLIFLVERIHTKLISIRNEPVCIAYKKYFIAR